MEIRIRTAVLYSAKDLFERVNEKIVLLLSITLSLAAIVFSYLNDYIIRYGDSESHLNIAKRVVDSITPGFAQLGGIWLPLPHMLMLPFIWSDFMWRSGLAGAVVSGIAYVVSAIFIYKTTNIIVHNKTASFVAALVFMLNPNVLYMQSTPMTELVLIAFFTLSIYFFIKFLLNINQLASLLLAAFFGFCTVLTRYDGWFLIAFEGLCLLLYFIPWKQLPTSFTKLGEYFKSAQWKKMEGMIVIFSTLAFFGIVIWLAWDFLILGDALYFTHSEFSAASQQQVWLQNGRLPAYHNIWVAFIYYFVTAMSNAGILIYFAAIVGLIYYLANKENKYRWLIILLLGVPFIFNVLTLFLGQSVIFIPHLTPLDWDHSLFNVRYGLMTVPLVAFAFAYFFYISRTAGKLVLIGLFLFQFVLYGVGYSQVISYQDGRTGLSGASRPEAERWIKDNYDFGLVLMDDYARTVSVVRSGIPMENMIYIGNKPYWEESLVAPDKYAEWIVMQENDSVWNSVWEIPARKARLEKYFDLQFQSTSGANIAIFKKRPRVAVSDSVTTNDRSRKFWNFQCIDTSKYSRDKAREMAGSADLERFIDQELALIKDAGATCVSVGTPYDEEFVPFLTAWANKAHEKGMNVWFRGNMSGWEGWFDYPKFTNPEDHIKGVTNLITKNPSLFEEGDIFTPAPEPENGILGDPRDNENSKRLFFEFLPKSYENCLNAFKEINVKVSCGYYSVNGDVARDIFTKDLLVKIGDVLVIDHYVSTPEKFVEDIIELGKKYDTPIVLGEFGAPIPDIHGNMTEEQQADFVRQSLEKLYEQQDVVLGINYWTFRGGSASIVNGEGTDTRLAYEELRNYFYPAYVHGNIVNDLGDPVVGVTIKSDEYKVETKTNSAGEYYLSLPATATEVDLVADNHTGVKHSTMVLEPGNETNLDFILEPVDKNIWYKFKLWWKNVRS